MNKALRPFRRRMITEGALRSAIAGGLTVLPIWLLLTALRRVTGSGARLLSAMPVIWAAVCALYYACRYRPTVRTLARRLDGMIHQDRVSTMVEFARDDSVLCGLQREDAMQRLSQLPAKALKIRFPASGAALCLILAALIALIAGIPDSTIAALPFARQQESEESIMLRGKIAQLREAVEKSEVAEADKARLLAQVDAMMERMKNGQADLSALQEIRQLMEDMEKTVAELTPRDTYAAAMLEFESLRALGEAIFKGNMDVVNLVFDNMRFTLLQKKDMEQVNSLMDLVYDVNASLAKPLRDNSQEILQQGMMMLASGLESAAQMVYNRRDNTQMIDSAIYNAKEYIREFLGVDSDEERYDPYALKAQEEAGKPRRISNAMALPSIVREPEPTETEHVYDPPEAVRRSGYAPGETDSTGRVQRILAPKDEEKDGTVPYGMVYGTYYARYLEEKSNGAIPEKLQDAAEAYFHGI